MKIAAFNVRNLGVRRVRNEAVRNYLIRIVSRYSVVVMLEVKDPTGEAMDIFLTALNQHRGNRRRPYAMECSEPLGRGSHREKYVFFYREDEVTVMESYQYEETTGDVFAREPFILQLHCPNTVVKDLVLIPIHTKPEDAAFELNALHTVVTAMRRECDTNNIMILGDFNADGRYLPWYRRNSISIYSAPYHWLIDEDADTTTSNRNDHTYDRIVVYGDEMYDCIVPDSAQPFNFQDEYQLSNNMTRRISDHYPVEVELEEE